MKEIKNLEPQSIWRNFFALTQVPRPSGHLDKIRNFLLDWAKQKGISVFVDNAGNVIMRKPATPGYENRPVVTMQGHMDMVPQKTETSSHVFESDRIEAYVDGEWVKAKETTLGADDGMGVATIMAVMEDSTLKHGPLEGFITVDEETCMYGVNHLKPDTLQGEILLNLDNETEGDMVIGSAGGVNITATMDYKEVETDSTDIAVKVTLGGLRGGHSGLEIAEGRANANKLMARFVISAISDYEARLCSWQGGNMRNAIPRQCEVVLSLPKENLDALKQTVQDWLTIFREEYSAVEHDMSFLCVETALPALQVPEEVQDNIVNAIMSCHNGVMRYIPEIPDIVETSSNLAIVNVGGGHVDIMVLVRSSRDSMLECNAETVSRVFAMAGMKIEQSGRYPAWQPNPNSSIVKCVESVYKTLFNEDCKVLVVHAGLECGVIGALYPRLDMVSFGPTIRSPHTPNERCHIPSVAKYYSFVVKILEQIPEKQ